MKKFAVFGNPISHSISPRLHNLTAKELNLDFFYGKVLLENGDFLKTKFIKLGLDGANITIPYKQIALKICDRLDVYAQNIGSINTIVKKDGLIYGYNTDAPGFLRAISEFKNIKSALILGAGGTAQAISYALLDKDIKVDILNRSSKRAKDFRNFNFYTWDDYRIKPYDLIVNSTSAGLNDNQFPAPKEFLLELFKNSKFALDVIYNKKTPFLNLAKELNLVYKDGKDMLTYQAVLALNIFYDLKLDEKKIEMAMKKAILL